MENATNIFLLKSSQKTFLIPKFVIDTINYRDRAEGGAGGFPTFLQE